MERQRIARLLPEIFQRTLPAEWWQSPPEAPTAYSALGAFLNVMELLHAPSEDALQRLDTFFDPRQAPEDWLPFLALWLDLDRFLTPAGEYPGGPQRLRDLILAAVSLAKERGTHAGLQEFLQTATGIESIEITTASDRPYHIVVTCLLPATGYLEMSLNQFWRWLEDLVAAEKPAYVTSEVFIKTADGRTARTESGRFSQPSAG